MHGKSCAGTSDAVARLQVGDTFADGNDRAGAAVARALRLVETTAYGLNRREDSVALHLSDDVAHQVGPGLRLLQQTLPCKLGGGPLGPSGHQRGCDANQNTAR